MALYKFCIIIFVIVIIIIVILVCKCCQNVELCCVCYFHWFHIPTVLVFSVKFHNSCCRQQIWTNKVAIFSHQFMIFLATGDSDCYETQYCIVVCCSCIVSGNAGCDGDVRGLEEGSWHASQANLRGADWQRQSHFHWCTHRLPHKGSSLFSGHLKSPAARCDIEIMTNCQCGRA